MSEDMVKKSVDIPREDDEWLEKEPINFSKWVRKQIKEKRAEQIEMHKKKKLYQEMDQIAEKGQELMSETRDSREEIREEYGVEIIEKDVYYLGFELNDKSYSTDWAAQQVTDHSGKVLEEGEAVEFAEEYMGDWQSKVNEFENFVEEETSFTAYFDAESIKLSGDTPPMKKFTLYTHYLPAEIEAFTVKYRSDVDIDVFSLEKSVDKNRNSTESGEAEE